MFLLSFPTRERGLKSLYDYNIADMYGSFPTRERGLKSAIALDKLLLLVSFPTRERGLKLPLINAVSDTPCRSPRGNVD